MHSGGVQNQVRVLVRGDTELIRAEARHHDVVAVFRADVVGVGYWTQAVRVILAHRAEADHSNRRPLVQVHARLRKEGAQLLKPYQRRTRAIFSRLRIDLEMRASHESPGSN